MNGNPGPAWLSLWVLDGPQCGPCVDANTYPPDSDFTINGPWMNLDVDACMHLNLGPGWISIWAMD